MSGPPKPDFHFDPGRDLHHREPAQLLFQISEIFGDRTYLQHGIEVGPGAVVIDAGANVGVAAAFFAAECAAGQVHSFEPVPAIHEMLIGNTGRFPAVHAYPFGLSDRNGSETFTYYEGAAAMSGSYADPVRDRGLVAAVLTDLGLGEKEIETRLEAAFVPVQVDCELRTLSAVIDEQGIGPIELLKIDVEKAELDVLGGVEKRHWPQIRQVVAEVHDDQGHLARVTEILESLGFTVAAGQDERMRSTGVFVVYAKR